MNYLDILNALENDKSLYLSIYHNDRNKTYSIKSSDKIISEISYETYIEVFEKFYVLLKNKTFLDDNKMIIDYSLFTEDPINYDDLGDYV